MRAGGHGVQGSWGPGPGADVLSRGGRCGEHGDGVPAWEAAPERVRTEGAGRVAHTRTATPGLPLHTLRLSLHFFKTFQTERPRMKLYYWNEWKLLG